jgi:hypothetical protein
VTVITHIVTSRVEGKLTLKRFLNLLKLLWQKHAITYQRITHGRRKLVSKRVRQINPVLRHRKWTRNLLTIPMALANDLLARLQLVRQGCLLRRLRLEVLEAIGPVVLPLCSLQ